MELFLAILGWTVFGLTVTAGLVLNLAGLFGNWIILAGLAGVWLATGFEHFGVWAMLAFLAMAVLGEVIEAVAAGLGASKFGGSRGGAVAAVVGCILGAMAGTPWFPVVGTLAGACLGAFVGAASYEYLNLQKEAPRALWAGVGAALGKVAGVFAKVAVGAAMLCVAALTY